SPALGRRPLKLTSLAKERRLLAALLVFLLLVTEGIDVLAALLILLLLVTENEDVATLLLVLLILFFTSKSRRAERHCHCHCHDCHQHALHNNPPSVNV